MLALSSLALSLSLSLMGIGGMGKSFGNRGGINVTFG